MEGQQRRAGGGRRRRRNKSKSEPKSKATPVLIAARRPDSPRLMKVTGRNIAASAQPKKAKNGVASDDKELKREKPAQVDKPRRVARIVQAQAETPDEQELRRQRLLDRLVASEGRSAISRIVDELLTNEFDLPKEQEVQLQLLEHVDEARAREAIEVMTQLLSSEQPIKRPILDQRLRRLEEEADDAETRTKAAALRRRVRAA